MAGVTRSAIAAHVDLTRAQVQELLAKKILPETGTLDEYRVAYIRHLRGRASGHIGLNGRDVVGERARLASAQAEAQEMKNLESRRELVRAPDVEAWLVTLLSALVLRLRAVPAKAAPEAHGAKTIAGCEAVIRKHQDAALEDAASAKWVGAPPASERDPLAADASRALDPPAAESALG